MKYFRLKHKETGTVMCYGGCDTDVNDSIGGVLKTLEDLYPGEYVTEYVSKEEYDQAMACDDDWDDK